MRRMCGHETFGARGSGAGDLVGRLAPSPRGLAAAGSPTVVAGGATTHVGVAYRSDAASAWGGGSQCPRVGLRLQQRLQRQRHQQQPREQRRHQRAEQTCGESDAPRGAWRGQTGRTRSGKLVSRPPRHSGGGRGEATAAGVGRAAGSSDAQCADLRRRIQQARLMLAAGAETIRKGAATLAAEAAERTAGAEILRRGAAALAAAASSDGADNDRGHAGANLARPPVKDPCRQARQVQAVAAEEGVARKRRVRATAAAAAARCTRRAARWRRGLWEHR